MERLRFWIKIFDFTHNIFFICIKLKTTHLSLTLTKGGLLLPEVTPGQDSHRTWTPAGSGVWLWVIRVWTPAIRPPGRLSATPLPFNKRSLWTRSSRRPRFIRNTCGRRGAAWYRTLSWRGLSVLCGGGGGAGRAPSPAQRLNQLRWELLADGSSGLKGSLRRTLWSQRHAQETHWCWAAVRPHALCWAFKFMFATWSLNIESENVVSIYNSLLVVCVCVCAPLKWPQLLPCYSNVASYEKAAVCSQSRPLTYSGAVCKVNALDWGFMQQARFWENCHVGGRLRVCLFF